MLTALRDEGIDVVDGQQVFLEARRMTYRHYGHSRLDPAKYRPEHDVKEWLARDPLDLAAAAPDAYGRRPKRPGGRHRPVDQVTAGLLLVGDA